MFDIPTIMEAPSEGAADSSPAESSTATSPEATASTPSGETQTTQGSATETTDTEQVAGDAVTTGEGTPEQAQVQSDADAQADRLDKHPRFKQVVTERRQFKEALDAERIARAQLEGRLQALESVAQPKGQQSRDFDAELAAIDAKLEAGDISLSQARAMERALNREAMQSQMNAFQSSMTEKMTAEQRAAAEAAQVNGLTEQFIQANPDFVQFRDSGELDALRQQNPLHDNVSAYYALKAQQAEAAKQEAVNAAVKAAEERVRKEFVAKQSAKTMQGSTSAPPAAGSAMPPELANPKQYGGVAAVLARRLEQRMASANH